MTSIRFAGTGGIQTHSRTGHLGTADGNFQVQASGACPRAGNVAKYIIYATVCRLMAERHRHFRLWEGVRRRGNPLDE
jgi:hypothetical protein